MWAPDSVFKDGRYCFYFPAMAKTGGFRIGVAIANKPYGPFKPVTYWTTRRGFEAMDNNYRLLDLTVYGRQQSWEESPSGWPQEPERMRTNGRPTAQWPRLNAGHSDDLGNRGSV